MRPTQWALSFAIMALVAACGGPAEDSGETTTGAENTTPETQTQTESPEVATETTEGTDATEASESTEIAPGLSMRVLSEGSGDTARPGQLAVVHYTGWLYDPQAPDNRGEKFDSSVDRGQPFEFPLGAEAVIEGWDKGVVGMQIGEVRELTIAPELAYGERGAGDAIPPGATLVFEVELLDLRGGAPETT